MRACLTVLLLPVLLVLLSDGQPPPDMVERTEVSPGNPTEGVHRTKPTEDLNDFSKGPTETIHPGIKHRGMHDTNPEDPTKGSLIGMDSKGRRVRIEKAQMGGMPLEYIMNHEVGRSRSLAYATQPEMCDACKTMVEEVHKGLHRLRVTVPEHATQGPLLHQNFSKATLKVVNGLCNSSRYKKFGNHIQEGCFYMLHGERRQEVLRVLDHVHPIHTEQGTHANGMGYAPRHCVWRRRLVCEEIFGVCPQAPPPELIADRCRVCAEIFRDFHYVSRRDQPIGETSIGFNDPEAHRKKRIYGQLMDLCEDIHMRHSFSSADHLSEQCPVLVDANLKQIMQTYLAPPEEDPARYVCVNVTRSCSRESFAKHSDHCEHEHSFQSRAALHQRLFDGAEL